MSRQLRKRKVFIVSLFLDGLTLPLARGGRGNYRFFDIFLDILHKMKENLGQEYVERELLSFQEKIGTIFPAIYGKITVFQF